MSKKGRLIGGVGSFTLCAATQTLFLQVLLGILDDVFARNRENLFLGKASIMQGEPSNNRFCETREECDQVIFG